MDGERRVFAVVYQMNPEIISRHKKRAPYPGISVAKMDVLHREGDTDTPTE
jgi:hypothetical protein